MATGGGQFSRSVNLASDETFEFVCMPCARESKHKEAVKYCTACGEHFCTACIECHNKFPGMSGHHDKLLDQSEMRKMGPQKPRSVPTEKCASHGGILVDMFCHRHDKIGCSKCITLEHRSCEDVDYIPIIATGIDKSEELKQVKTDLEKIKQDMTKLKSSRKTDQARISKERDEVLTNIKDFRKRMNNILDKLDKSVTDETDQRYKSLNAGIQADINTCDDIITSMARQLKQIESADTNNESQLFVDVKRGKERIESAGKVRDEMLDVRNETIKYNIDPTVEAYLNNLKSLGKFTEEPILQSMTASGQVGGKISQNKQLDSRADKGPVHCGKQLDSGADKGQVHSRTNQDKQLDSGPDKGQVHSRTNQDKQLDSGPDKGQVHSKTNQDKQPVSRADRGNNQDQQLDSGADKGPVRNRTSKKGHPYSASGGRDIDIMKEDKETCDIWASCQLQDGQILVTDTKNKKLKLLDSSLNVVDHCDLRYRPYGVCSVSASEAAVAVGISTIQFVSLQNKLKPTRSIKLDYDCLGIAYSNEELYTTNSAKAVHVYNTAGAHLHTYSTDQSGGEIFSKNKHIAVSDDGGRLYVADLDKGLICLDKQGSVIWTLTDPDLRGAATGCCVDKDGNVFVCGFGSGNVLQISPDGQKISVLLNKSDGLIRPLSVCYDRFKSRIIVTMRNQDHIKVFDLT